MTYIIINSTATFLIVGEKVDKIIINNLNDELEDSLNKCFGSTEVRVLDEYNDNNDGGDENEIVMEMASHQRDFVRTSWVDNVLIISVYIYLSSFE